MQPFPQQPYPANQTMPPNPIQHGGHEMFDVHEVLSGIVNVLDEYLMFEQYVKDPELQNLLQTQNQYISHIYNQVISCLETGQGNPVPPYALTQNENIQYGQKPSPPKKPDQTITDVSDKGLSGHMLGLIKSVGSLLAMSAPEITNHALRKQLAECVPPFVEMAYDIFLYQNKHAYYQVPQLNPQDMSQMASSFAPINDQTFQ